MPPVVAGEGLRRARSKVRAESACFFGERPLSAFEGLTQDLLFNEATSKLTGTSRGSATVDGTPVHIVRVALKDGFPIDLYVDPVSGAYLQAVIDPDGSQTETVRILSYMQATPGKS